MSNDPFRGRPQVLASLLLCCLVIASCQWISFTPPNNPLPTDSPSPNVLPQSKLNFVVRVPGKSSTNQKVFLDILDEVTGLALNPLRYPMAPQDDNLYSVSITMATGSVIKYRYSRDSDTSPIELTPQLKPVRYRLRVVGGNQDIKEVISAWEDAPFEGASGKIEGRILDANTQSPVSGMLITVAGYQTLSASDGTFLFNKVPVGTHNIVVYSMDGAYQPFQQEAIIGQDATTPAVIQLNPTKRSRITFRVQVPANTPKRSLVRMVGNIYSLGNTFADLRGGISVIAARAPILTQVSTTSYTITLELPVGLDLRYKYTLGDGIWNSEQTADGKFRIRQLIVPAQDAIVDDIVSTWQAGESAPISFRVNVPLDTPVSDTISIQFNPYGWTEPVPMWPIGNHEWQYVLFSPLNMLGSVGYRYCRNDQCGRADDKATSGVKAKGYPFSTSLLSQNFQDDVNEWQWWKGPQSATTVVTTNLRSRGEEFIAGIELEAHYHPSWQPYMDQAMSDISELGANWIFLTPSWTYTTKNPPMSELVPGVNPLWLDLLQMAGSAQSKNLNIAVFPIVYYAGGDPVSWWDTSNRDEGWWQNWFDRYEAFILHHAILATQTHSKALVIGGQGVSPALPGGRLTNGESSGVPDEADIFWEKLIKKIKARYQGLLIWALPTSELNNPPAFLSEMDMVYILWNIPIDSSVMGSQEALSKEIENLLDKELLPLHEKVKKPFIIGLQYPAVKGAESSCVVFKGKCIDFDSIDLMRQEIPGSVSLKTQSDLYNAFLIAINERSWINGLVSRGYYPPVLLQDKSPSIHGKPSADILWFWFPRLRGKVKP